MNFKKSNRIQNSTKSSRLPDTLFKNESSRKVVIKTKHIDLPNEINSIIRNPFKRDYIEGKDFQGLKERDLVRKEQSNPYYKSKSIIIMDTSNSTISKEKSGNGSNRKKVLTQDYLFSVSNEIGDMSKIQFI